MNQRAATRTVRRPVPFFVHAPQARDVRVTGDFTHWTRAGIRLNNDGHGLWRALLSLRQGRHEYRLLMDGVWADHEEAIVRVDNPYGTKNCILSVSEENSP